MKFFKRYRMRLILTVLGLAAAISFLTLGFFKTSLILVCCGVGYLIGYLIDNHSKIPNQYKFWRKKW